MSITKKLIQAAAGNAGSDNLYVEDVFSTFLYAGTGAAQTITNGIDLAGEGGMVWIKKRNSALKHLLYDTNRGIYKDLNSDSSTAEDSAGNNLTAFNSNGFSIGNGSEVSSSSDTRVSWTFRKAEKFFDVVTFSGNSVAGREIAHNLGATPAFMIVKSTSDATAWWIYHTSTGPTKFFEFNNQPTTTDSAPWNNTAPTDSVFTVGSDNSVNGSGRTYVAYLFASDAGGFGEDETENIIKCGSFSGIGQVDLGFEPQFLLYKPHTQNYDWVIADNMRRLDAGSSSVLKLEPNSTDAEANGADIKINATGFYNGTFGVSYPCIYIAIRRPMKTPTAGTEVFSPVARTGTGTTAAVTGVGFSPDLFIGNIRDTAGYWNGVVDRLRGVPKRLISSQTEAENTQTVITSFDMDGLSLTSDGNGFANENGKTYIEWLFKRAPGFMDVVAWTGAAGTLNAVTHGLGVKPELVIVKYRTVNDGWYVYTSAAGHLSLEGNSGLIGSTDYMASTTDTSLNVTGLVSNPGNNPIAYLFATVAGVSKVGSYTGTGSALNVDCGFSAGARFVLIKRTDATGNWFTYDSARGIVAGADPYLLLNSTAAEDSTNDEIDPLSSGFSIPSGSNVNTNGGTYIFLAIA